MQKTQASLKHDLNAHLNFLRVPKLKIERQIRSFPSSPQKNFMGPLNTKETIPFSKENSIYTSSAQVFQTQDVLQNDDCINADNCFLAIKDPLWKRVCHDVIRVMGVASFLKIWDSILGEFCSQDQSMEINCQSGETAQFIQQYEFVILGCLQPYFPALKRLRIKTISSL